MIYIVKNTSNNVALTLNENITLACTASYFLFEIKNDQSNITRYFTGTDISTATHRYNQFTFIDSQTEDIYNSTINFETGFARYKVYEMPIAGTTSFSPTASVKILEEGKVYIKDITSTDVTVVTPSSTNDTNVIL